MGCQRPLMRATLEAEKPSVDLLTYRVMNVTQNPTDLFISAAIENQLNENGFFKNPFESDLKIYFRHTLNESVKKREKKIEILIIDARTTTCIWRAETVNLAKDLSDRDILVYTHLLMKRFDWHREGQELFVVN